MDVLYIAGYLNNWLNSSSQKRNGKIMSFSTKKVSTVKYLPFQQHQIITYSSDLSWEGKKEKIINFSRSSPRHQDHVIVTTNWTYSDTQVSSCFLVFLSTKHSSGSKYRTVFSYVSSSKNSTTPNDSLVFLFGYALLALLSEECGGSFT